MKVAIVIGIIVVISVDFMQIHCLDREMTIVVNAKAKECFYERVEPNHIIDLEYQVIICLFRFLKDPGELKSLIKSFWQWSLTLNIL
jgi:hypothetical protein